MTGLLTYLENVWPVLAALSLAGLITYGALTPYIRRERKRRERLERSND